MNRRKIYYFLKEYFSFARGERNGIYILMGLILIVLICRMSLPVFFHEPILDNAIYEKDIQNFEKKFTRDTPRISRETETAAWHAANGVNTSYAKHRIHPLDINRADSAALVTLPGIGPVFAGRIVKYRTRLGGFVSKDQLAEVYGLKAETLVRLSPYIRKDTFRITTISVNSATFKELNAHPYISFDQTKVIVKYRRFHKLHSYEEFKKLGVFSDGELGKIRPYLQFD